MRVPFGELSDFLRTEAAHQLTPGLKTSTAGRLALWAFDATVCDDRADALALSV